MKLGRAAGEGMPVAGRAAWMAAALSLAAGLAVLAVLYAGTLADMAHLWANSSAYNHGVLILPAALWLAWERRDRLRLLSPRPSLWGAALVLPWAAVWFVARVAGISEGMHFAVVGMVQGMVLAALGPSVMRALLFPVLYLFLMVPTGTFLLDPLQRGATLLSTELLRLSGIPTFVDGFVLEVPSGTYVVEPGCAGLNFLLASLALALVFADLMYRSFVKRVVAVQAALLAAVLGNAVRIWGIIALAHVSDHRIDIVDDHLLWGWGFFALVMAGMMVLGLRFRDPAAERWPTLPAPPPALPGRRARRMAAAVAVSVSVAALAPLYAAAARVPEPVTAAVHELLRPFTGWR